ncbi:Os01g0874100 [Oryza sativa Japonica Group]|uniref:Os01g0874100 protein n=1 Tax=Oryza sativa subsp. japonica TaxID=39947 RepID=A0A0P0VAY9_ORYSJ|nr:hypothetical protein EE612_007115 [Oryza sativa]BAS75483.1 Os01g0874100 [Oryza sativa Japonica Group]
MHRLVPRAAASFLGAPPLLTTQAGPLLAARSGPPNPSRLRLRLSPWRLLRSRRGLSCSADAAKRCGDDDAEEDGEQSVAGGGGSRPVVDRRQRSRGDAAMGSGELLAIPGVGPRNLRKLVDKGFDGVAQLKQLYRDKFFGKSNEKMVEFLQSSVGIIHKNHAESITLFIKESVDEELKGTDSPNVSKNKRLTFCVEGNISVGKTTFLQRIANETIELRDLVEIVPEPIAKWQDVGPDHFNILDAFYAEPQRYAYTFQNYVFVNLRASPDTCHKRMMVRKRSEEGGVTLDYLRGLHEKHESWLLPSKGQGPGVLSVSQVPVHMEGSLPPDIRERVFYLEGDHMHSSIQKVPALVLDCEHDIDFNKDIEAKRQYARQVAEFFEFVKKKKEDPSAESSGGDKSTNKQIMLPHRGGLWVPEGNPLPGSALNSLDFRRAMSSFLSA